VRTSIPTAVVFGLPCSTRVGRSIEYDRGLNCIRFDPPRRFKGVWQNEFEGSYFVEGAKRASQLDEAKELTWLDVADNMRRELAYRDSIVEIEFVGRKTSMPGDYGHGGLSKHEIVLEKMINYRPLQPGKND